MERVNAVTLCHIGTEFVIIAGVTFWLTKRISALEERVAVQNDIIGKYEEIINNQNQILMRHEQIIRQITGNVSFPVQGVKNSDPDHNHRSTNRQTKITGVSPISNNSSIEDVDISDSELDRLIGKDEIKNLNKKNLRDSDVEDPIELICEEDRCDLKRPKSNTKVKKRRGVEGKTRG